VRPLTDRQRLQLSLSHLLQLVVMTLSRSVRRSIQKNAKDAGAFSQLTYLLHIVSSINQNDPDKLRSIYAYDKKARDEAPGFSHPVANVNLLDSIVAILVQHHEVVAACYTSDMVSVVVAETDPKPSTVTYLDDPATDSDEPPSGPHAYYPLRLAAVSNPDFNASGSEPQSNANQHNLQIQSIGNNLWTRVRDSCKWYCAFK